MGDELLTEITGVKYYTRDKLQQLIYETPDAPPELPKASAVPTSEVSQLKNDSPTTKTELPKVD